MSIFQPEEIRQVVNDLIRKHQSSTPQLTVDAILSELIQGNWECLVSAFTSGVYEREGFPAHNLTGIERTQFMLLEEAYRIMPMYADRKVWNSNATLARLNVFDIFQQEFDENNLPIYSHTLWEKESEIPQYKQGIYEFFINKLRSNSINYKNILIYFFFDVAQTREVNNANDVVDVRMHPLQIHDCSRIPFLVRGVLLFDFLHKHYSDTINPSRTTTFSITKDLYNMGKLFGFQPTYMNDTNMRLAISTTGGDEELGNYDYDFKGIESEATEIALYRVTDRLVSSSHRPYVCYQCNENIGTTYGYTATYDVDSVSLFNNIYDPELEATWTYTGHPSDSRQVKLCPECVSNEAYYCERCDTYSLTHSESSHDDDDDCGRDSDDYTRETSSRTSVGETNQYFTNRFVGVEIEVNECDTEFLESISDNDSLSRWGIDTDGSLSEMGIEFITNLMSGDMIGKKIELFYSTAKKLGQELQDSNAGLHINVDMNDIYSSIGQFGMWVDNNSETPLVVAMQIPKNIVLLNEDTNTYSLSTANTWANTFTQDLLETMLLNMGHAMTSICKKFVSKNRANNNIYCASPFGFRNRDYKHDYLKKTKEYSYPAIALRTNRAEFRIYPSTNNLQNVLARIELSQKLINFMASQIVIDNEDFIKQFKENNFTVEEFPGYYKLLELGGKFYTSEGNTDYVKELSNLIGLSDACTERLSYLHDKFYSPKTKEVLI